jgi:hypothetical protein
MPTRHEHLQMLLGAWNFRSIRFTAGQHTIVAEIRMHFHETGEQADTIDYDAHACIEQDIEVIEQFLRETR